MFDTDDARPSRLGACIVAAYVIHDDELPPPDADPRSRLSSSEDERTCALNTFATSLSRGGNPTPETHKQLSR